MTLKEKLKHAKKHSDCKYKDDSGNEVKILGACQCSKDKSTTGWCKVPYNDNVDAFKEYQKQYLEYVTDTKNEVHRSRGTQPLKSVKSDIKLKNAERESITYTKFYNADKCALKVLTSSYVKISTIALVILAFIF